MRVYTIALLLVTTVIVGTPIGADAQDSRTVPAPADDVYYATPEQAGTASTMPDRAAAEVMALEREIEALGCAGRLLPPYNRARRYPNVHTFFTSPSRVTPSESEAYARTIALLLVTTIVGTPIGADAQDSRTVPAPADDVYYATPEQAMGMAGPAAVVRGDVTFVDAATAPTFTFTHGDGWTTGGAPLRVDSRADWIATVAKAPYASRVLDSVKTEVHGDVVITYGRYVGRFKDADPGRRTFTVWYERVYAKRNGRWQYLSHRTVDGPRYERD